MFTWHLKCLASYSKNSCVQGASSWLVSLQIWHMHSAKNLNRNETWWDFGNCFTSSHWLCWGHCQRHHSPKARQKSINASWAWTPQAWSFSRGGNSLTSASLAFTGWTLAEKEEEEGKEERVLCPELERVVEVSTGGEAVREEWWTERWCWGKWYSTQITQTIVINKILIKL